MIATDSTYFFYACIFILLGWSCQQEIKPKAGTAVLPNGSVYKGMMKEGLPDGIGEAKLADGSTYKGEWKAGYPEGKGSFTFGQGTKWEGDVYEGQSKLGKSEGLGTYRFANGSEYQGSFSEDKFHGNGSLHLADGTLIKGNWEAGVLQDGDFPADYEQPQDWYLLQPEGDSFSIRFPSADLNASVSQQESTAGLVETKAWQFSQRPSEQGMNLLYSFSYTDFDRADLDANDPNARIAEIDRYWKNIQRGEANVLINTALADGRGRALLMDFVRDEVHVRTRCFFVGQRFYKLLVITNYRYLYNKSNQFFFDSFVHEPSGNNVK